MNAKQLFLFEPASELKTSAKEKDDWDLTRWWVDEHGRRWKVVKVYDQHLDVIAHFDFKIIQKSEDTKEMVQGEHIEKRTINRTLWEMNVRDGILKEELK